MGEIFVAFRFNEKTYPTWDKNGKSSKAKVPFLVGDMGQLVPRRVVWRAV